MDPKPLDRSAPDDAALLARAHQGDRSALEGLCARYRDPLVRFCLRYLGRIDAAEDAAHEVLARVSVDQRLPDVSFRAWVYRIARNQCLSDRRNRHEQHVPMGSRFGESRLPSPRTGPGTAVDRDEQNEALHVALSEMPAQLAEVLALKYFQGLGRAEMAEVLELSESVVKHRLVQAREELSRKLEQREKR